MAVHDRYKNHPLLARFDRGWRQYAAIYGVVDMLLWRAYLAYLADYDEWDGDPLWYHQWLAANEEATLSHEYAEYATLEEQPLSYEVWLVEMDRVAGVLDQPLVRVASHEVCTPLRPMFRVQR